MFQSQQPRGFASSLVNLLTSPQFVGYVKSRLAPAQAPAPQYQPGYGTAPVSAFRQPPPVNRAPAYSPNGIPQANFSVPFLEGTTSSGVSRTQVLTPLEAQSLGRYDIRILVDRSGSMDTKDCPAPWGAGPPISRWEWCRLQTSSLADQTRQVISGGITVVPFANRPQRLPNASSADIGKIFRMSWPEGSTELARAMEDELDHYFREQRSGMHNRPLLMAVITDGVPSSKKAVKNLIKETVASMEHPGDVRIVFLQVGMDRDGDDFLRELDHDLTQQGVLADIVATRHFGELVQAGLPRTLAQSITATAAPRPFP